MEHSITESGGHSVVAFKGDVDLESSPEARKILLERVASKAQILVDMSAVDYIDSSGIASLVESFQAAKAGGQNYALVSVSASALRVLELARLDKVFPIFNSIEDALSDAT